jgi:DNA-3-methyladenine glycosylase II
MSKSNLNPPSELNQTVVADAEDYLCKRDKKLAKLIREVGPCAIDISNKTKFEMLISAIVSQQLSGKASTTIYNRLIECAGSSKNLAKKLVNLNSDVVRSCGVSTTKTNSILRVAELVATKQLDLDAMMELDDETIHRKLTAITGIGPWTVQMFLMFALRRPDVFSTGDAGLRRGLKLLYGLQNTPSEKEMLAITERWRPYRTVGAWYLWRVVD